MHQYIVSRLSEQNINNVAEVFIATFKSKPWNESWQPIWVKRRIECILDSPFSCGLVVSLNEQVIGAAVGRGIPYFDGMDFELAEFFIHPSYQGASAGKCLLNALESALSEESYQSISLLTAHASIAETFYESRGFEKKDNLKFLFKPLSDKQRDTRLGK